LSVQIFHDHPNTKILLFTDVSSAINIHEEMFNHTILNDLQLVHLFWSSKH